MRRRVGRKWDLNNWQNGLMDALEYVGDEGMFSGWKVFEVVEVWELDVKLGIVGVIVYGEIVGIGKG